MKQVIKKAASITTAKALAKSTILKQKTVTYTKTKFIMTKEFMKYVATDPLFQGKHPLIIKSVISESLKIVTTTQQE